MQLNIPSAKQSRINTTSTKLSMFGNYFSVITNGIMQAIEAGKYRVIVDLAEFKDLKGDTHQAIVDALRLKEYGVIPNFSDTSYTMKLVGLISTLHILTVLMLTLQSSIRNSTLTIRHLRAFQV